MLPAHDEHVCNVTVDGCIVDVCFKVLLETVCFVGRVDDDAEGVVLLVLIPVTTGAVTIPLEVPIVDTPVAVDEGVAVSTVR